MTSATSSLPINFAVNFLRAEKAKCKKLLGLYKEDSSVNQAMSHIIMGGIKSDLGKFSEIISSVSSLSEADLRKRIAALSADEGWLEWQAIQRVGEEYKNRQEKDLSRIVKSNAEALKKLEEKLDENFDNLIKQMGETEKKQEGDRLEKQKKLAELEKKLAGLEEKLVEHDRKIAEYDRKIAKHDERINELDAKIQKDKSDSVEGLAKELRILTGVEFSKGDIDRAFQGALDEVSKSQSNEHDPEKYKKALVNEISRSLFLSDQGKELNDGQREIVKGKIGSNPIIGNVDNHIGKNIEVAAKEIEVVGKENEVVEKGKTKVEIKDVKTEVSAVKEVENKAIEARLKELGVEDVSSLPTNESVNPEPSAPTITVEELNDLMNGFNSELSTVLASAPPISPVPSPVLPSAPPPSPPLSTILEELRKFPNPPSPLVPPLSPPLPPQPPKSDSHAKTTDDIKHVQPLGWQQRGRSSSLGANNSKQAENSSFPDNQSVEESAENENDGPKPPEASSDQDPSMPDFKEPSSLASIISQFSTRSSTPEIDDKIEQPHPKVAQLPSLSDEENGNLEDDEEFDPGSIRSTSASSLTEETSNPTASTTTLTEEEDDEEFDPGSIRSTSVSSLAEENIIPPPTAEETEEILKRVEEEKAEVLARAAASVATPVATNLARPPMPTSLPPATKPDAAVKQVDAVKPADTTKTDKPVEKAEDKKPPKEFAVLIPTTARAAAILNCTANSNELAKQYSSALDAANQVIGAATAASTDDAEKEALYGVLQGLEGPLPLVKDVDFTKKDSVDAATNKTLAIMLGVEKYKDEGKDKADKIEKTLEEIDKEAAEKLEKAGIKDQAAQQQLANLVKARMVCNRTKGIELNKAADVDDDLKRLKFQDELAELAKKGGQAVDLSKKKTPEERLKDLNAAVKDGTAKQIKDGLYAQIGPDGKPVYSMTKVNKENIDEVVKSLSHEREIIWSNIPSGQKKVAELACLKNWQQASFEDTRPTRLGERAGDFVVQKDPYMTPLSKTLPERPGDWAGWIKNINDSKDPAVFQANKDALKMKVIRDVVGKDDPKKLKEFYQSVVDSKDQKTIDDVNKILLKSEFKAQRVALGAAFEEESKDLLEVNKALDLAPTTNQKAVEVAQQEQKQAQLEFDQVNKELNDSINQSLNVAQPQPQANAPQQPQQQDEEQKKALAAASLALKETDGYKKLRNDIKDSEKQLVLAEAEKLKTSSSLTALDGKKEKLTQQPPADLDAQLKEIEAKIKKLTSGKSNVATEISNLKEKIKEKKGVIALILGKISPALKSKLEKIEKKLEEKEKKLEEAKGKQNDSKVDSLRSNGKSSVLKLGQDALKGLGLETPEEKTKKEEKEKKEKEEKAKKEAEAIKREEGENELALEEGQSVYKPQ